jgi:mono/diheme cytochrome c family protein
MVDERYSSEATTMVSSPRRSIAASPRYVLLFTAFCLMLTTACRQDMQDQPKMKPYRQSTFFSDGLSSRQPVPGTVARGFLREDKEFFTGKKSNRTNTQGAPGTTTGAAMQGAATQATQASTSQGAAAYPDDIEYFPIEINEAVLERGRERYEIFCSVCHGQTGNGDGMIVRRGFKRAASFHDDRLRQAPVGHFFDAITNGWGVMPSYAPQLAAQDRWAIIAYIRALQLSQLGQDQPNANQTTATPQAAATPTPGGHQ